MSSGNDASFFRRTKQTILCTHLLTYQLTNTAKSKTYFDRRCFYRSAERGRTPSSVSLSTPTSPHHMWISWWRWRWRLCYAVWRHYQQQKDIWGSEPPPPSSQRCHLTPNYFGPSLSSLCREINVHVLWRKRWWLFVYTMCICPPL